MTTILAAVTLFCAVLVVLDRVPERYLTSDLVRLTVKVRQDRLRVMVACEAFLFEWRVNDLDFYTPRKRVNGMRLLVRCENWWTVEIGGAVAYKRVMVDSREWSAP